MPLLASLYNDNDLRASITANICAYVLACIGLGLGLTYLSYKFGSSVKIFHAWLFGKFPQRFRPPTFPPAYRLITVNVLGFSLSVVLFGIDFKLALGTWFLGLLGIIWVNSHSPSVEEG